MNLKLIYKPQIKYKSSTYGFGLALSFSADGEYLYGGGQTGVKFNGNTWRAIRRWTNAGQGSYTDYPVFKPNAHTTSIKALPNGDLIVAQSDHIFGRMDKNANISFYKEEDQLRDKNGFSLFKTCEFIIGCNTSCVPAETCINSACSFSKLLFQ